MFTEKGALYSVSEFDILTTRFLCSKGENIDMHCRKITCWDQSTMNKTQRKWKNGSVCISMSLPWISLTFWWLWFWRNVPITAFYIPCNVGAGPKVRSTSLGIPPFDMWEFINHEVFWPIQFTLTFDYIQVKVFPWAGVNLCISRSWVLHNS